MTRIDAEKAFLPLLVSFVIIYILGLVIYRLLFHPLSKVPGPKLLAISGLSKSIRLHLSGTWFKDVLVLHEKYGRIVRIGPDEIAVDGDPAWDECFSLKRSGKLEFARDKAHFDVGDTNTPSLANIFVTDRDGHRRQRRLLAHAFSNNAMYEQEPIIQQYVEMLIIRLHELATAGKAIDATQWYNYTTFDIIGDLTFGESFDCLQSSDMHPWVAMIFDSIVAGEVLRFLTKYPITRLVTMAIVGDKIFKKRADNRRMTEEKTKRRLALGQEGNSRKDFMSYILKHNDNKGMNDEEIIGNSEVLVIAGSETTATALSGLTYYLAQNPSKMQKVIDEVRKTFKSAEEITMKSASALTYTHACIEESLRLFPPVVVTPARVSPGDVCSGYYIPKDTRVIVHQWASHRYSQNWSQPHSFIPERFLPEGHPCYDPAFASDNKKCFRPFSYGPLDCIGKNLAYAELHLIIVKLLWNFKISLEPESEGWAETMKAYTLWVKPPLRIKLLSAKLE